MKKTIFVVIFNVMAFATAKAFDSVIDLTIYDALSVAMDACSDNDGKYDYYVYSGLGNTDSMSDYYSFFVDLKPGAGWEHPCRYVYVKKVRDQGLPAVVKVKDAVRPSSSGSMKPLRIRNRYGSKADLKPKVKYVPSTSSTENRFAGKTYAVILSGGMNKDANEERYWNDCSFLYQVLRKRYDIPKKNITVIMSDGRSPGPDMKNADGEYVSSPIDLDGDGSPDIGYAATKSNVRGVLHDIAYMLKDEDQLFLYVVDHGGYDSQKKQSYICLWNDETLYPDELAEYLGRCNAGYINIVMGQCYSGGFVDALKGRNRVIATACAANELSYGCEELPFDEFVYHWTSAINGFDAEGKRVVAQTDTLPSGKVKPVTYVKAFEYAKNSDIYADGKFLYAEETPVLSYANNSTAEDLALDTIPPTVYLCITRNSVSKPKDYFAGSFSGKICFKKCWDSSDIWLRNEDDGMEVQEHQTPNISEKHNTVYVYTKIKNRGVKPYLAEGWSLATWYVKSSLMITRGMWDGIYSKTMDIASGSIGDDIIDEVIEPGDSLVKCLSHTFSRKEISKLKKDQSGDYVCLLSNVYRDDEPSEVDKDDGEYVLDVWNTDRLAQNNRIYLPGVLKDREYMLNLLNPFDKPGKYHIMVEDGGKKSTLSKNVRMKMGMSGALMDSWKMEGASGTDIIIDPNDNNTLWLKSDTAIVCDLELKPRQLEKFSFSFSQLASMPVDENKKREINVAVFDSETGICLGGETFILTLSPRQVIMPVIEKTYNADGTYLLTATNINEEVTYEWFDSEGKLIGVGPSITVPANSSNVEYSLEVKAKSDAAISSTNIKVDRVPMIYDIHGERSSVDIAFNVPVRSNTIARLLSSSGSSPLVEFKIEEGVKECSLATPNLNAGIYQVTLVENGIATETYKFIK